MISKNLAIIGVGNMGSAIASGLLAKKVIKPTSLILFDPSSSHMESFEKKGAIIETDVISAVKRADIVLLAIKPQVFPTLLLDIKNIMKQEQLIISIAAGIEVCSIKSIINISQPVIRVMPNLCATVGESMSVWVKSKEVNSEYTKIVKELLSAVGREVEIDDEELLDTVTAISGSGPAYIFYLTEIMEEGAKSLGMNTKVAQLLARQTVIGSAKLLAASDKSPVELRQNVTSKGGTTEAAIAEFEKSGLKEIFLKGIKAAYLRAKDLK